MSEAPRQSLTLIVRVTDSGSCTRELEQRAAELAAGWSRVPGVRTACLAFLPAVPGAPCALLFESSFVGDLSRLARDLWRELGPALSAIFQHCEGYPLPAEPNGFAAFLRERARRATPLSAFGSGPRDGHPHGAAWRRATEALFAATLVWPKRAPASPTDPQVLEQRCAAVGFQESEPGVPLVHVAEILPGVSARGRLKRALRAAECEASGEPAARFLLDRERLVFLAYPKERAARFSERLSQEAGLPLARIWAQTRGLPYCGPLLRRALRRRRIERFVLGERVPVAAWFNAG
jgi:hypothetical protein